MEHFASTTVIHPHVKIRRVRTLPRNGEVVVKVGQSVPASWVVARTPRETNFALVDASEVLGIPRDKVADFVMVEKEALVDMDTVLAQKRKFLRNRQVLAPEEGVLFDVINGRIVILQTSEWLEQQAMVSGRIVSATDYRSVIIETQGTLIQGVWGSGKENFGQLKVVSRSHNAILTKEQITDDMENLILVAGRVDYEEVLEVAAEKGINGLIAGSMPANLCQKAPSLAFPVILTDGVGKQNMTPAIFNLLQEADGQEASLFGLYDIHRGERPEIIIPTDEPTNETLTTKKPVRVGQKVRILRAPFMGQVGEVVKLYQLSQVIATGAKAQGVDVRLADGNTVFIPYANFDMII